MLENERAKEAFRLAEAEAARIAACLRERYGRGRMTADELYRERTNVAGRALRELKDRLLALCREEGLAWDGEEWERLDGEITRACDLRYAEYRYHPVDLGFDELVDDGLYILRDAFAGLDGLLNAPEPVGQIFPLTLRLKDGDGVATLDCTFTVRRVSDGERGWEDCTCFEGTGRFTGYSHSTLMNVRRSREGCESTAWMTVRVIPDDPVWKKRKPEIQTGRTWVCAEDYPPEWMGEIRE